MKDKLMVNCAAAMIGLGVMNMVGCYETLEHETAQPQSQPQQQPLQQRGSGSALGKARDSARGIVGDAEQRSQEIADTDY